MNPFDAVISAGVPFIVLDLRTPSNKTFRMLGHRHVRCLHLLQSTADVQRKTVRLRKSRHTRRQCRCNQHRKSPIPTINTRESYRRTKFRIVCVDTATEFCESRHQQTGSRPDDARFHVQAWTRRTTKQFFQQDVLSMSWRSDRDDAKNN